MNRTRYGEVGIGDSRRRQGRSPAAARTQARGNFTQHRINAVAIFESHWSANGFVIPAFRALGRARQVIPRRLEPNAPSRLTKSLPWHVRQGCELYLSTESEAAPRGARESRYGETVGNCQSDDTHVACGSGGDGSNVKRGWAHVRSRLGEGCKLRVQRCSWRLSRNRLVKSRGARRGRAAPWSLRHH